ncbi:MULTISPECIES: MerR family transcriptional regulator [Agrobacterium]|uniref:MerR family transcriptional regulator n=1 Tax=Agrobacterium salinitolerans TaxID=1183413 RepID=A0A9X3QZE7_9HYPH|nr:MULTISPECIES: MerR family transcriptional regulator [Agrobacterium]MCZ7852185.1 MerR family transcriptional regulator [Agrobacterium salinitolerans]MCZ7885588.1 MerR family transcriptional regulator [Agrobacterium salinitolerans]MCZ7892881.1 MerR family transcriptional regulator [Agrobacterium salinitolerans]MCZ7936775.1 MerR family transcriptional regulator [Agrobacterium salinitolerans]MCZ7975154.1 MerR family transcriptional regulator [Agrobacterium salinitolerans]
MKIGELSLKTGVSIRMLRYYEAEGLLTPSRTKAGYRDYSVADVDTVERILLLGNAGMTLANVREFLPCSLDQRQAFQPCDELKSKLRMQIGRVEEQMNGLSRSRKLLTDILATFEKSTPASGRR